MEEVYRTWKTAVLGVTESVVRTKEVKTGKRKGSAWWTMIAAEVLAHKVLRDI